MRKPLFELNEPLEKADVTGYEVEIRNLQGNILKSHGRGAAVHVFLTFHQGKEDQVKKFLRQFAGKLTSAAKQQEQAERYRTTHEPGEWFASVCLSASGYEYLGFNTDAFSSDEFKKGMRMRGADLGDPPPGEWELKFQRQINAMLILADDQVEVLTEQLSQRRDELESFADISIEFGLTMRNAEKNPIEHFGYADGVSQPIFFESDVKKKNRTNWDPRAGPNLVLVKDPYGGVPTACGTYFVFRKLEQNVRAFKDRERELAKALSLHGSDDERAGAMVVGRFENGTPLELHPAAARPNPRKKFVPDNDFNYKKDHEGNRCPLSAHIRLTNPRTDDDKRHRIARRGITYGDPTPPDNDPEMLPEKGVGLLFQCCQADLRDQFEYLQRRANDAADPIIGQPTGHSFPDLEFPKVYNKPDRGRFGFHGFVTMKGGEYFFVPSISFFKNLK